ncbi:lipopolysaccharide assembly protein LapB [Pseudaquabacterium rugosum]|jgi:lipopolysaccharide biosynthesis regulator YciM|uniref:Lipopolysaccharide assembly protein B n=1 Tax=Pseudaquabacterium rugosum TaxID=2984194 RepID=A0ABU9B7J7_9BURK
MPEFDWTWLLLGLPLTFALGWLASRIDLRQWQRTDRQAPRAYFKGLNLLLAEQPDKAIDAFIEAVQADPDTSELHFTLGNLFRRRGEFERAVRVHEHLLQRADLAEADRQRAQHALAQDYMKAGLFDRAEEAFRALEGSPFETESRLALLGLHERSRDWRAAADIAQLLEKSGTGSFAQRISHYQCELALQADERGEHDGAAAALERALETAPQSARPWVLQAQRQLRLGQAAAALDAWTELRQRNPEAFARLAADYVACAQAAGQTEAARQTLAALYERHPSLDLLRALAPLEGQLPGLSPRLLTLLRQEPSLGAVMTLLDLPFDDARAAWNEPLREAVRNALVDTARPLQRYRCAACGFESQRHFWQCPGCLSWDSFPNRRLDES